MIQHTNKHNAGFTLTELMLAVAFIGFILIFIVVATVQVIGNYNKGLAIKQINQTARTIVEDIGRIVHGTNAQSINITALNAGRVCFGGVSYVWNIRGNTNNNTYTDNSLVGFARVNDAAGALCVAGGGGYPKVDSTQATELITGDVWVQNLGITVAANQALVNIALTLSTSNSNQPTGPGNTCQGGTIGNFCAVASFSTTANTRNGGQ